METLSYDIVIVGGGATGLRAAYEVSKSKDISCAIISKVHPLRSQSCMAQGGINAALGNNTSQGEDSIDFHIKDTIEGGEFLSDQDAVEFFCEEAPECLIELEHLGMVFSRSEDGKIAQRTFGGGALPRTCFSRDYTGHMLLSTLYTQILKNDVKVFNEFFLNSLIIEDQILKGILVIDIKSGEIIEIQTKALILATGGASNMFGNNVNSVTTTGDGIGIAYRAGVPMKDIEFIQFHPTSLSNRRLLITEAARAEGGHLINNKGERFMKRYDVKHMELGSRDIVSQAIQSEIDEGRDINGHVLLDLRHLGEKIIKTRLPQIHKLVMDFAGIDCIKEPVPVNPSAHYFMGGIDINIECETNIKGLFAAGECACVSIHGANRLGGNSLMETIVFGKKAGDSARLYAENNVQEKIKNNGLQNVQEETDKLLKREKGETYIDIKKKLNETMDKNTGIFRSHTSLSNAIDELNELKKMYKNVIIKNQRKHYNFSLFETLELNNLIYISEAVLACANERKESRGAHFRKDFPQKDNRNFLKHSLIQLQNNKPEITYKDVKITNHPAL